MCVLCVLCVRFQVYDYTCCCIARLTQGLSLSCGRLSGIVSWNLLWATHGLPCRAAKYGRILTPLLSSQSSPFSDIRIIRSKISAGCGCSLQLVVLFEISLKIFLLAVTNVAIHLAHANANLFLFR